MKFTKYHKLGAYHWKMFDDVNTKYHRHAIRMKDWIKEKSCLDIGAGDGFITHYLGIKGVDNEIEAVRLAQEKGADVILSDAYTLPFKDEEFESAFMGDVLEHMEFPKLALREMKRVISKYFYIASPIPEGKDKFHYAEWDPGQLLELVEKEGFKLCEEMLVVLEDKRIYAKFKKI